MNSLVTKEMVDDILNRSKVRYIYSPLKGRVGVVVTLPNGMELFETLSYKAWKYGDEDKSIDICMKNISEQIKFLEEYRLYGDVIDDYHLLFMGGYDWYDNVDDSGTTTTTSDDSGETNKYLSKGNIEEPVVLDKVMLPPDPVYDKACSILSVVEGGWVNHSSDKGGETIFGIARNFHPEWKGWDIVDDLAKKLGRGTKKFIESVNNNKELYELSKDYYKANFWYPSKCDYLPEEVAICTFDFSVNSGIKNSQRQLQEVIRKSGYDVPVDGRVGPISIEACRKLYDKIGAIEFVSRLLRRRYEFYQNIVKSNPSQKIFLKGWVNRLIYLGEKVVNKKFEFLKA